MDHGDSMIERKEASPGSFIGGNGRNVMLISISALFVCVLFFIPQTAFSTLTFADYSNSTSSTSDQTSTTSTNQTSTTTNQTVGSSGTSSSQTSSTYNQTSTNPGTGNNSTGSSSNNQTNTQQSNSSSTAGGGQSSSGGNSTTSTGGNLTYSSSNSTNPQSNQSSQSQTPLPAPQPTEQSSDSGSGSVWFSPSPTPSSSSSESVISPSIVVSAIGGVNLNSSSENSTSLGSGATYTGAPILPQSLLISNDQSYYAYGDVVTIKAVLPGFSAQNVAMVVADPTGNDIVSRTVTTDQNGTAELQFKIPSNFGEGVYTDVATTLVDGKNYTNSTDFNVIKTHGISIDSVRLVDQQGNPSSMIKKGQNNFVQVSLSSGETMPALLTINLFDTNQSSIGTASVKSVIKPGDSQMTLSFFIPPGAQVGTSDIFTDAYSDWPANGGMPLTTESCLSASLEDPTTLPVSYEPSPPQACTERPQNLTGTTLVSNPSKMTNDQASVTLGIAVQNDSMTFMSPTQAHLLALAYQNGTATNLGDKSITLVNLNLNDLNSTAANTTSAAPITNFTTLVGPDLQNDPMAQKILQEIQVSKRQVANIIGNETAAKIDAELVQKQRLAAASQLKQDLTALAQAGAATTPSAAYTSFLATVPDNRTQQVFEGEFNFMQQRVSAAHAAMQNVLDSGGSWDQAVQTFDSYAAINHAQIVAINQNLNVEYGLADSSVQSCFDSNGDLAMVNGTNPCIANLENNSTDSSGIRIVSVEPTDQNGNKVSLFTRGQSGFVRVDIQSGSSVPTLVTVNLFDSSLDTLGTASATYAVSPGNSEVVLPYYVPAQSSTGLATIYANVLSDWPNKGGTPESHELSYFIGLS